ncbi:hypothetical protein RHGRI_015005 [Rhododendron griersonianum]|uniref:Uncharacterized protein n=1 Tax=Rhododendron griersonianum TaxID=479676 RepID=A0AAV6KC41_9ERIC|nr:hypothetical protein RHGRI_015005 [Rhododendron griersonianum]
MDVDPWLPKSNGFHPIGVSSEGAGLRVCDVINASQHVWKMEVIDAIMQEKDAKAVRLFHFLVQTWRIDGYGTSRIVGFIRLIDRWKGTDDRLLTLAAMIMWRIWKCRNEVLFNGADPDPSQMVVVAVKEVEEFILAMREQIPEPRQPRIGSGELAQCWQKPECGKMKFNVDGAWVSRSDGLAKAGAGIVGTFGPAMRQDTFGS